MNQRQKEIICQCVEMAAREGLYTLSKSDNYESIYDEVVDALVDCGLCTKEEAEDWVNPKW